MTLWGFNVGSIAKRISKTEVYRQISDDRNECLVNQNLLSIYLNIINTKSIPHRNDPRS